MKVGFFFNDPLPRTGGVFTYQQDIFHAFLRMAGESRHQFYVICEPERQGDFASLLGGVSNISIAPMVPRVSVTPWRWRARKLLNLLRGVGPVAGDASVLNARRESDALARHGIEFTWSIGHYEHNAVDVPYITTVFDLQHRLQPWFPEVSQGALWQTRETYFHQYVNRAAYVITGTQEGQREIERFYQTSPARIRILPLPTPSFSLNAPPDAQDAERLRALGVTGRFLFYPAQFWPHKNHANLLHALKLLNQSESEPFQLALVGSDHGNLDFVRKLAQDLGLSAQILFLGFVTQENLIALYRNAYALAYTSLFGPDNLPPLEAFALNCPVIMSDYDGAREQLGGAPLYVDSTDPREFANAIQRLDSEPGLRERMISEGRKRAQTWTAQDYVRGIFDILDEFESIRRCWP